MRGSCHCMSRTSSRSSAARPRTQGRCAAMVPFPTGSEFGGSATLVGAGHKWTNHPLLASEELVLPKKLNPKIFQVLLPAKAIFKKNLEEWRPDRLIRWPKKKTWNAVQGKATSPIAQKTKKVENKNDNKLCWRRQRRRKTFWISFYFEKVSFDAHQGNRRLMVSIMEKN